LTQVSGEVTQLRAALSVKEELLGAATEELRQVELAEHTEVGH
jgi:hypothetical protein